MAFFSKVTKTLWGDLSRDEYKKFGLLALTFLFIIGTYWLMRPLKDSLFGSIVGIEWQPRAKMLSFLCIIPLIMIYSKLVDLFDKQKLFYFVTIFYSAFFLIIAFLLMHPAIGLGNPIASPKRILGWVIYVSIESFGSLVVALFWSYVASTTEAASAKRGYALIISGAQFGSIMGPTLGSFATTIGTAPLMFVVSLGILISPLMIKLFTTIIPENLRTTHYAQIKSAATGPLEGIKLLLTRPYLLGIFGVATLYEVVGTIMDYQMKVLAFKQYLTPDSRTAFLSLFGQSANTLALVFALIGTSYFMRKFGLTFCLVMFPVTVGLVVTYVYINPVLWVVFGAMIAVKGLSYALNNPSKEVMYIPTSKDIKFKAKSWIDAFGGRSAKATGSAVTDFFRGAPASLMFYGTLISLGIVGLWIFVAFAVGNAFNKLQKEDKVVS
ncbi:MAG: Npt1/Npt2 family nucleotide transporter [bacterium]